MSSIPPTMPDFLASEPVIVQPKWPKVVGILSIVFSGLGLVCGGCGLGMLMLMPWFFGNNPDVGELPPTMKPTAAQLVLYAIGFGFSVLLLVAGVLTLRRHPASRPLHLLYAIASIPLVAGNIYLAMEQQGLMEQWIRENPNSPFAKGQSTAGNMIGLIFGAVMGLAYPLFLMVWYGFVKRSAADLGKPDPQVTI